MLNLQNVVSQMMSSSNPLQMITGMLNPQQKQFLNQFQNQTSEKQAEYIADYCNKNNISREQLSNLINMFYQK